MGQKEELEWSAIWRLGVDESDPEKRLAHFRRALEMARKQNSIQGKAASEAAVCMVQAANEKGESVVFKGSGVLRMVREPSVFWSTADPAFCTSRHDFRDAVGHQDWELVWQPMFPYGGWDPSFPIPLPPALNKSWERRSDACKALVISSIVSTTDDVDVDAGTFGNCLRLKTEITHDEDDQHTGGTVWSWFAPKVGLVKEQYCHNDGDETLTQLVSFSVINESSSEFPLDLGNRWEYRGTKRSNSIVATHVFWVEEGVKDVQPGVYNWFIPYYSYAILGH